MEEEHLWVPQQRRRGPPGAGGPMLGSQSCRQALAAARPAVLQVPGACPLFLQVAKKTVEACRSYLELPHFNREAIFTKSRAAAGLCEWAINIVKYYDVVGAGGGAVHASGCIC